MDIYRITRIRKNPHYYQSKKQVLYGTAVRAAAIALEHHERGMLYGGLKIERAPVGEFEDVTAEFVKGEVNA